MSSVPVGGIITSFITMSDRKDEIDWEFVGGEPKNAQTNVFYKGIHEYGVHMKTVALPLPGSTIDGIHEYTIDWRPYGIAWLIDGQVVRTYMNDFKAVSRMTPPGERWFPSSPSKIQIGVWDGCLDANSGTCSWSKGPIKWGSRSSFTNTVESLEIQCYDNKAQPVPKWPTNSPNKVAADPNQPTSNFMESIATIKGAKNNGSKLATCTYFLLLLLAFI